MKTKIIGKEIIFSNQKAATKNQTFFWNIY